MPNVIEGTAAPPPGRFAVVASRFNREVVDRLVDGALAGLRERGVPEGAVDLVWVPGAFELPLVAKRLAASGGYLAVIALGAVIKGDTDHYEHVATQAAAGLLRAGLDTGVPVLFGVLTCATDEQALDRAGGKEGNKGFDAALAAVEMADLLHRLARG
jgi:6,7-dimethyl-8-ribityllumazine synthase